MARLYLIRRPDWQARLTALLASRVKQPFEWGVNDCAALAFSAIEAQTGTHPWPELFGYQTFEGGMLRLRRAGYDSLETWFDAHLPRVPAAQGRPGDVALWREGRDWAMGVVQGAQVYVMRPEGGLGLVPLLSVACAWRVG